MVRGFKRTVVPIRIPGSVPAFICSYRPFFVDPKHIRQLGNRQAAFSGGQCLEDIEMLFVFTWQTSPFFLFPFVRIS